MVQVSVEHCVKCGYTPHFEELQAVIKAEVPEAEVLGVDGRTGSFEITVNGELIHSKIYTNSFPDFDEVAEIVKSVEEGGKPRQVTKTSSAGCSIM